MFEAKEVMITPHTLDPSVLKMVNASQDDIGKDVVVVGIQLLSDAVSTKAVEEATHQARELAYELQGKDVIITGRAPLWLYAAVAHALHPARRVAIWYPPEAKAVVVEASRSEDVGNLLGLDGSLHPGGEPSEDVEFRLNKGLGEARGPVLVEVRIPGKATPATARLAAEFVESSIPFGPHDILVTGRMPAFLLTALTNTAAHRGRSVSVYDPRLAGFVVVIRHDPNIQLGRVIKAGDATAQPGAGNPQPT